jgi:hypothetical protein
MLKSSILQFKNNVHEQAKRIMQSQENALMTKSANETVDRAVKTQGSSTTGIGIGEI